jgi:hypothetical protein
MFFSVGWVKMERTAIGPDDGGDPYFPGFFPAVMAVRECSVWVENTGFSVLLGYSMLEIKRFQELSENQNV